MTDPQPTASAEVAEWLRDRQLTPCEHRLDIMEPARCAPCLRNDLLSSDWLAAYVQAARDEERARVEADHRIVYESGLEAVCFCGAVLSIYGLTRSIASVFGQHVRDARGGAR